MTNMKRAIFLYDFQRMSGEEFVSTEGVGDSDADAPKVTADNTKGGATMPLESSKVLKYQACSKCTQNQITEVLFHSHVSHFDQLVKMIAVIGQHFETHSNVAVVVLGDSTHVEKKGQTKLKSEDDCHDASMQQCIVLNGNSDHHKDDPGVEMNSEDSRTQVCSTKQSKKKVKGLQKKVFCCDECGKTFKERSSLWRHRKVTHEKIEKYINRSKQTKEYTCPVCKEVINDTYQRYFLHKQQCEAKATGVNPYICSICGRSFPTTNQHGNHFTTCSGKGRKYYNTKACSYEDCQYKTSSNIELDNHVKRTHLKVPISKNHVCTLCGNAYNKVAILNQHIKSVHLNEKPHECPTCGRSFARKQKMKDHMKIHTGEAKYTCPLCSKQFNNGDSRWNHKKTCPGKKEDISLTADVEPFIVSIV